MGGTCLEDARVSGISCLAIARDARRHQQGVPVASNLPPQANSAAAGDAAVTVLKKVKPKAASAPAKASIAEGMALSTS